MTKIKLCGLSRPGDVETANDLQPEYVGFVFVPKSKRFVPPEQAAELRKLLLPGIQAVGVFVNQPAEMVAKLLNEQTIDIAQLHGSEDESYIAQLRRLTRKPIIHAFRIADTKDIPAAEASSADYVLLDSGAGTGTVFDWNLIGRIQRPYFLAGGLNPGNVGDAIRKLHPFAVDVSSGIETEGRKDPEKMAAFVAAVRREDSL